MCCDVMGEHIEFKYLWIGMPSVFDSFFVTFIVFKRKWLHSAYNDIDGYTAHTHGVTSHILCCNNCIWCLIRIQNVWHISLLQFMCRTSPTENISVINIESTELLKIRVLSKFNRNMIKNNECDWTALIIGFVVFEFNSDFYGVLSPLEIAILLQANWLSNRSKTLRPHHQEKNANFQRKTLRTSWTILLLLNQVHQVNTKLNAI